MNSLSILKALVKLPLKDTEQKDQDFQKKVCFFFTFFTYGKQNHEYRIQYLFQTKKIFRIQFEENLIHSCDK